jgi:hypothetical protein
LLKDGPFRGADYSLMQRLHYLHGMLNWLCKPFIVLMLNGALDLLVLRHAGLLCRLYVVPALRRARPAGVVDLQRLGCRRSGWRRKCAPAPPMRTRRLC